VALEKRFAVHLAAHVLDSAILGYGLADSPAGLLAWTPADDAETGASRT
jgi:hypothetical protein